MGKSSIKLTGILLAGGKSKRMGREKGSIRLKGGRLFEYPLSVMESFCDEILISTCNENSFQVGHQTVCDEIKGIGPLGGIYTCLRKSSEDLNLVLSCDMPLVNQKLISYLIHEWKNEEVLIPADADGRPEPLCGLYRKNVIGILETMIDQEIYAVRNILSLTRSRVLKITEEQEFWRPDLFLNINRDKDLQKIPPGTRPNRDEN